MWPAASAAGLPVLLLSLSHAPSGKSRPRPWQTESEFMGLSRDLADLSHHASALPARVDNAAPTGAVSYFLAKTAPSGWLALDGGSIGNAGSGATARANDDTKALFTHLWEQFSDAEVAIQTSAGAASTRGASAAADFAAGKRIVLVDARGEFIRVWDNGRGVDAGRVVGSSQLDAFQGHWHAAAGGGLNVVSGSIQVSRNNPDIVGENIVRDAVTDGVNGTPRTASETRPRNIALLACIKL